MFAYKGESGVLTTCTYAMLSVELTRVVDRDTLVAHRRSSSVFGRSGEFPTAESIPKTQTIP